MGHPGGMDAGIVAAVGVQHGPLVEGHEIRVKSGQGDALVRQPDLAGRLAKSSCGWPLPATAHPVRARTSPEYGDRSHRGGGHAVQPEVFGGHALHGFAVGGFAGKQRTFGMAVPVDEAGAEDAAFQNDRVPGEWLGGAGEHGGDEAVLHTEGTPEPRGARAVHDPGVAKERIKHGMPR